MKKIMFALLVIAMFLATTMSATANYNSVDAAVAESLAIGERREIQVGANIYEVSLIATSGRNAKFQVNGEVTDLIAMGQRTLLADYSEIGVIEVAGNKVEFWIDAVPTVSDLNMLAHPMKESGVTNINFLGREYEVKVVGLDRAGAKVTVNGERILMRNPKEKEAYGYTHYRLNDQAMLRMDMIVIYNNVLYCSLSIGHASEVPISKPIEAPAQPPVDEELTYDQCVSNYLEKAREYETWRQNYPEADRLKIEGLRVCGERFGKLVPVPPRYSESDHYRCMMEGSKELQGIAEDEWTDEEWRIAKLEIEKRCERFVEVVEERPEYERCIEELSEFKRMLVERYDRDGRNIPEELMQKYEEMNDRCRLLSGEWRRTRPMPAIEMPEEVAPDIPAIEMPEEVAIERWIEKPMPPEFRRECSGCMWENSCLPIGTRLVKENGEQKPLFCNLHRELEPQRPLGEQCQNNYACVSNSCHDGVCQSIGAKIEGIEKELREQRGIMEKILGFFGRIFGKG